MTKKFFFFILFLIISCLAISYLYNEFFIFSVFPGDEAIVTQSGEVIGLPRTSGYHKINPFTQEVHQIEMAKLRKWEQSFTKDNSYTITIYWNIDDSMLFYKKSQQFNIEAELESSFVTAREYIESNFSQRTIEKISMMKRMSRDYKDADLMNIVDMLQNKTEKYGVKIVRVDFLAKSRE